MRLEDCIKTGLLQKVSPDIAKAKESLSIATNYIKWAEGNYDMRYYNVALICAYNAMFHAARAILQRDGIKERSHICIVLYLREQYVKRNLLPEGLVNILDLTRRSRHKTQYGGLMIDESEALVAISKAKEFLEAIAKLISDEE